MEAQKYLISQLDRAHVLRALAISSMSDHVAGFWKGTSNWLLTLERQISQAIFRSSIPVFPRARYGQPTVVILTVRYDVPQQRSPRGKVVRI